MFNFKVTFTIQSCINQTLFVVTRRTKDVKPALSPPPPRAGIVSFTFVFEQRR